MSSASTPIPFSARAFGATGLTLPRVGLGGAKIGGVFSSVTGATAREILSTAIDHGITFFDTANIYTQGESETTIGLAVAGRRSEVAIASKAGYVLPGRKQAAGDLKRVIRPIVRRLGIKRTWVPGSVRGVALAQDFATESLVASVEQSLRRLKTDYLDVLFLHSPSREVLQHAAYADAAEQLVRAGKVRAFGVSCEHAADVDLAIACEEVTCVQLPLSVLDVEGSKRSMELAREAGVGVVGRQCLAAGILLRPDLETMTDEPAARAAGERAEAAGIDIALYAVGFSVRELDVDVTLLGLSSLGQLEQAIGWLQQV